MEQVQNGTYQPTLNVKHAMHKSGFYVSLEDYECRVKRFDIELVNGIFELYRLIASRITCTAESDTVYVGVWHQGDHVYFDLSQHVTSMVDAIRLGQTRKQLSIYDIAADQCINIPQSKHIDRP